jgi:hypothetical protein
MNNGTSVNVPLYDSGATFTAPDVEAVSSEPVNSEPVDSEVEEQMGGDASAALAAIPPSNDPSWRQALIDACTEARLEKAYMDKFFPPSAASGASGSRGVLPSSDPLYALTQIPNNPNIALITQLVAAQGYTMPPIAGASQAVPAVPLPSSSPYYSLIVANPNPAIWGPILAGLNPPYTMPDLPLASGATGPLSTKDQWKEEQRPSYALKDPLDIEILLQDGMTAEQVQMTVFRFNLRQYISIKAAALAAAEIAWRTANNFAAYDRIAWANANVDMNIFDTRNAYLYGASHDVTTKDLLQRMVLMEARILGGVGVPAAAPVAPVAPAAPGQPPVAQPVGVANPNAMLQPIMAAINNGIAPLSALINKVGSAVTKVSKAVDASTAKITGTITESIAGLSEQITAGAAPANNANQGGGRRSRRKSRA